MDGRVGVALYQRRPVERERSELLVGEKGIRVQLLEHARVLLPEALYAFRIFVYAVIPK